MFAGELLGVADDWAARGAATFTRPELEARLEGLEVIALDEVEEDRDSFDGPKHWHSFTVVARRP